MQVHEPTSLPPSTFSSASTGPRFLLVIASAFPALKGYSEVVRCNLPANRTEDSGCDGAKTCVGLNLRCEPTPLDADGNIEDVFDTPPALKRQKQLGSLKAPHPAMNVHGSMYQAGVYGTSLKENSLLVLADLTNAIP